MAHDVFISYSNKDKPKADAVCAVLESKGIRCWIAPRDVRPGDDWGGAIIHAIAEARVFVLVFSAHANESPQIKREVERAVNRGMPVIPVRLEDAKPNESLEFFLSTPHWLDAFPPPMEKYLLYLADVILSILAGESGARPPSPARAERASPDRRWYLYGAAAAAIVLLVGTGGWLAWRTQAAEPKFGEECRKMVPDPEKAGGAKTCAELFAQAQQWEACSTTFARANMDTALSRANRMIATEGAANPVYYDAHFYQGSYGAISHYWEKLGVCVDDNYLDFQQVSDAIEFPEYFWDRTRKLRELFLAEWSGPSKPLTDFMQHFQLLCQHYKAARAKAGLSDANTLDCRV